MASDFTCWLASVLLLVTLGSGSAVAQSPHQAPLGAEFDTYTAPTEPPAGAVVVAEAGEPTGAVALQDAVAAALLRNPALAGFSWEIRVQEARAVQAGLLPNPELGVELENVGGSGSRSATEDAETTVWLSQLIPLGGKRGKRQHVADLGREAAEWDYETTRLDVLTDTTKTFVATLTAQRQLDLVKELERLAAESVRTAAAQLRAGAAPAVEHARAQVVLSRAQLEQRRVERDLAAARAALAATWGDAAPAFSEVTGDLSRVAAPPALAELEGRVETSPDVARWTTEVARRRGSLSLEKSQRIPDPTVSLGGRHFSDNGDNALVFEFRVPIPVFDRNQGSILAAQREIAKAQAERAAAVVSARSTLAQRYQDLAAAFEQSDILQSRTLPAAQQAFAGVRDAYRKGLFRYLDVLDAQRTLFELRAQYLEALSTYHQARADIERLTGTPLARAAETGGVR
jgi:cobalt-zinc-cadmium efflux system outer membrane protein